MKDNYRDENKAKITNDEQPENYSKTDDQKQDKSDKKENQRPSEIVEAFLSYLIF